MRICAEELPFQHGEELKYDIHYKYGFVMLKAGTAIYSINADSYNGKEAWKSTLNFKTTSFFDKIFKIRDTLSSKTNDKLEPLYHQREIHEGSTHFCEKVSFKKFSHTYSEARVWRRNAETLKFDTVLFSNNAGYDILNVFMFSRSLDFQHLNIGESFNLSTFIGKRKVNIIVHFKGQMVISKSETLKYKTYKLVIDVTDEVFSESKSAMEVWISDDDNRIPLKIKAKLKIGMAEADLMAYQNLKYPLSSEIRIPAR
jgi:hypothetical protein